MPDYPGRFQDGIDTGISSRATTPVAVVVAHADPAPVVPEIVLNLASDIFELGAITTPRPPVPPTSDLERAADAGMCGYDIGQTIGGNSDWLSTFIGCISAASSFSSSTAAPNAPGTHGGVPAPRRSACSFDGETEVVMADGSTKPIEDVEVGDRVVATDPETGESGSRRVTHVWVHDDTVVDLEVDGEVVTTTEDHRFWNDTDGEWQASENLDPGDRLLTADGDTITVDGLDWSTAETAAAYNLTVDDLHTYYIAVGDTSALVHNDGCAPQRADDELLEAANRARDRAGLRPDGRPNRDSPVYVGGYSSDGTVMGTGNGPRGSGIHAEDIIQDAMPGARMTEPYAWRRNVDTGELEWVPFTVCPRCQGNYPPELFPPGTRGAPGGAWDE